MTKRTLFLFWLVLLLSVLACGLFSSDEVVTSEPPEAKTAVPETDTPQIEIEGDSAEEQVVLPTETPEPTIEEPQISLGEQYRSEEGGYLFLTIPDAMIEANDGYVFMLSPEADEQYGPGIVMVGNYLSEAQSLDEVFKEQMENMASSDTIVSEPQEVTVGGAPGLQVDMSSIENNQTLTGKIIVVLVSPNQMFMLGGMAPLDEWDDFSATFEAVIESVAFFDLVDAESPSSGNLQPKDKEIRQWASYAWASSSYDDPDWNAVRATGAPDVPPGECIDHENAWTSEQPDTLEWLDLIYDTPVIPTEINILQTHSPDQVVQVEVFGVDSEYHEVYTGTPQNLWDECPYVLSIPLDVDYGVVGVRITIDQSIIDTTWNQIDAVELVGYPLKDDMGASPPETGGDTGTPSDGWALQDPPETSAEAGLINDRLLELGYEMCFPTEFFTPQTQGAVKKFQRINGLEPSGVVDTETWDALFSAAALPADKSAQELVFSELLEGVNGDKIASSGSLLWVLSRGHSFLEAYDTETGELAGLFSIQTLPGEANYTPQAIAYDQYHLIIASQGQGGAIVQVYSPNVDPTVAIMEPLLEESIYLEDVLTIRGLSFDGQRLWLAYESTAYPSGLAYINRLSNQVSFVFEFGSPQQFVSAPVFDRDTLWAAFEGVVMGDAIMAVNDDTGEIIGASGFCGNVVAHDLAALWVAKEYEVLAVDPYGGGVIYGLATFDSSIKDLTFSGARIYVLFEDGTIRFYQVY